MGASLNQLLQQVQANRILIHLDQNLVLIPKDTILHLQELTTNLLQLSKQTLIAGQVITIPSNKLVVKHTITTNQKAIASLVQQENMQSQRQLQRPLILDPKQATKNQAILNRKKPIQASLAIADHKAQELEQLQVEAQAPADQWHQAEAQVLTDQHHQADQEAVTHHVQDNY